MERKQKSRFIIGSLLTMSLVLCGVPVCYAEEPVVEEVVEESITPTEETTTETEPIVKEEVVKPTIEVNAALQKEKKSKLKSFDKKYKSLKKFLTSKQKSTLKSYRKKIDAAVKVSTVKKYYSKAKKIFDKVDGWFDYKQASCYGPYEGETITATGKHIDNKVKYVAVPMNRIVSKKKWKKLSAANKKKYFYYGERIKFKYYSSKYKKSFTCVATVQDCGGFGGYGATYKGKYRQRLFDMTPGTFHALHLPGTGFVKWKYL